MLQRLIHFFNLDFLHTRVSAHCRHYFGAIHAAGRAVGHDEPAHAAAHGGQQS